MLAQWSTHAALVSTVGECIYAGQSDVLPLPPFVEQAYTIASMLFRGSIRQLPSAFRYTSRGVSSVAAASTHAAPGAGPSAGSNGSRRALWAAVPLAVAAGAALTLSRRSPEDDVAATRSNIASVPTSDLVRAYLVYTVCGMPTIVDAAPALLNTFSKSSVPGVAAVTNAVIRRTFFSQFVAGEDLPETMETLAVLNSRGIGALLNYGAEAELGDGLSDAKHALQEHNYKQDMLAIEALGEYERRIAENGGKTGSSQFAVKLVSTRA